MERAEKTMKLAWGANLLRGYSTQLRLVTGAFYKVWQILRLRLLVLLGLALLSSLCSSFSLFLALPLIDGFSRVEGAEPSKISKFLGTLGLGASTPPMTLLLLVLVVAFAGQVVAFITTVIEKIVMAQIRFERRRDFVNASRAVSWHFIAGRDSGWFSNILSRQLWDALASCSFGIKVLSMACFGVVFLAGAWVTSPALTLVCGFAVLVMLPWAIRFSNKRRTEVGQLIEVNEEILTEFQQLIRNFKYLLVTGQNDFVTRNLHREIEGGRRLEVKNNVMLEVMRFATQGGAVAICGTGAFWLLTRGEIAMSQIVVSVAFLYRGLQSAAAVLESWGRFFSSTASIDHFQDAMDRLRSHQRKSSVASAVAGANGSISIRNVHHSFGNQKVLRGISLEVRDGEVVGLVGRSGAGKTTLIDILTGAYSPDDGKVLVGGIDPTELSDEDRKMVFGIVPQEPATFRGTVGQNLTMDSADQAPESQKIVNDVLGANFAEFERMITDSGSGLSGGQKQRLALARELVRFPKVLVLDEGTSALDAQAEGIIQEIIQRLKGKLTIILIAHKLHNLRECDGIYVMDEGSISEKGTWSELRSNRSLFQSLCDAQGIA